MLIIFLLLFSLGFVRFQVMHLLATCAFEIALLDFFRIGFGLFRLIGIMRVTHSFKYNLCPK